MKAAIIIPAIAAGLLLIGCSEHDHPHDASGSHGHPHDTANTDSPSGDVAEPHAHSHNSTGSHDHPQETTETPSAPPATTQPHGHPRGASEPHGHPHDTTPTRGHHDMIALGTIEASGMNIRAAQGHGAVEAGKEGHLVIKLPYTDNGATVVRAWIGTKDRTMSAVGKGDYSSSNDVYDIHAVAPSPLPNNVEWWVAIEKPDGTEVIGSIGPVM